MNAAVWCKYQLDHQTIRTSFPPGWASCLCGASSPSISTRDCIPVPVSCPLHEARRSPPSCSWRQRRVFMYFTCPHLYDCDELMGHGIIVREAKLTSNMTGGEESGLELPPVAPPQPNQPTRRS